MTQPPATIGKYAVVRELGRGASSTVYLGDDPFNKRKVAIKRIHPHLIADERQGVRYRRLLRKEATMAGQLRHPHIVSVYDADVEAEAPYIVLEYVPGAPLSHFTSAASLLPVGQVLDICYTCCSAMEYAHTRGLVHRDLKPANILMDANGDVKLTDFGTALQVKSDSTQTLGLVGSPMYMAPEQVREQPCTNRSDMFSLAVTVYELLTGRRPFEGDSEYATLYKISNDEPTPPSMLRPGLPEGIDDVLMLALSKRPEHRFAQWMDFAEAVLAVKREVRGVSAEHRDGERFAQMRKLPFFAEFPDQVLWEALRLGVVGMHPRGYMLMEEGAAGDSFYVLIEGRVAVVRKGWKVAQLDAGVTLGEMSYLRKSDRRRTATAVAETPVVVLEIRNEALRKASEDLQLAFDKAFIDLLLNRLITTTEKLGSGDSDGLVVGGDSRY
ncbi:protein kinase domain-containing protein [Ramlibacter albus]|uniref:Protein kinase n=1 Tax=Ramlibacter albus TaxID=2079448 RepID=A0A923M8Y1_9BURK|nr:protein kinase [Ramlibacter albus]MBC5765993.1 protein kinase [Ramlibacter albus]